MLAMIVRGMLWLAVMAGSLAALSAQASPLSDLTTRLFRKPMIVYRAVGAKDSCGPGCSEWIAVEGSFNAGSAQRFQAFMSRHRGSNLPVFFDSPGGLQNEAAKIGRFLHRGRLTAGVWKTIPEGCAADDKDKDCRALKTSGRMVRSSLQLGACNSACVYALLGASVRQVPPGSKIGVHSAKHILMRSDGSILEPTKATAKKRSVQFHSDAVDYFREVKADPRLLEIADHTPFEQVYFLNRDEIADFGIDRRPFVETPWLIAADLPTSPSIMKLFVDAKGPNHNQYRVSGFRLSCSGPLRTLVLYFRGLASEELAKPAKIFVSIGVHKLDLSQNGAGRKIDVLDKGGSFGSSFGYVPFQYFDEAVANDDVSVVEPDPMALNAAPHDKKLSTQGLSDAIRILHERCASGT